MPAGDTDEGPRSESEVNVANLLHGMLQGCQPGIWWFRNRGYGLMLNA
jgi:hypothetical protein